MKNEKHFAVKNIASGDKSSIVDIDIDIIHILMLCCRRDEILKASEILKARGRIIGACHLLEDSEATAKKSAPASLKECLWLETGSE